MKRTDLTDKLKRIAPALSTKEFVPILTCICFEATRMHAYDDSIALQFPYALDFTPPIRGAVRGRMLLDWLNASKATEVEFKKADGTPVTHDYVGELHCKAGRSTLKVALLPPSDFVFKMPEADAQHTLTITKDFVTKLAAVLPSMGVDPAEPWRCGVTVFFGKQAIGMYTTDNKAASLVRIAFTPGEAQLGLTTIMPPRFCNLLVDISGKDEPIKLAITAEWVEVTFKSGLVLFSKTIAGANVEQYQQIFKQAHDNAKDSVELPGGMERCLERALVVAPYADEPLTELTVKDGRLHFRTPSAAGDANDEIAFEGHPDVVAKIDPSNFKKVLSPATTHGRIVRDSFVVLLGEGVTHLITLASE